MSSTDIKEVVKEKYGQAALRVTSGGSSCCGATASSGLGCDPITTNLYDAAQAGQIPEEALLASLGCGNPTALAQLNAGEVVLTMPHSIRASFREQPFGISRKCPSEARDLSSGWSNAAGGQPDTSVEYRGRYLDLSVLGWALRNRHMTPDGFLKSFGLKGKNQAPARRMHHHQRADIWERDVERTVALLNKMKREYDGFPLRLEPEWAMS